MIIHQIKLVSYDFLRNVVPNIMRPTLKHACPSHDMQAVPRGMLKRTTISYLTAQVSLITHRIGP